MAAGIDGESSTRKVEYANLVLTVINEDIGRVQLRVTAALGLAAVFVTQLPLEALRRLPLGYRITALGGIVLLGLAAVALFYYTHRLNRARIAIAAGFISANGPEVANRWINDFGTEANEPWIWLYNLGQWLLAGGGLAFAVVIGKLLLP
jgi:hypothetical protein